MTQLQLPRRILVPVETGKLAEPALEFVARLPEISAVELVHVWELLPLTPSEAVFYEGSRLSQEPELQNYQVHAVANAEAQLEAAQKYAESIGLTISAKHVEGGDPARKIVMVAEESRADMIVCSTHQRHGVSRWWWASVTEKVVRTATCPVVSVPAPEDVESP